MHILARILSQIISFAIMLQPLSKEITVYVALPVMDEELVIRRCLKAIQKQTYSNYKLYACVNQPDSWWDEPSKVEVCHANARVMSMLREVGAVVIDKTSRGKGWQGKDMGVGWARKVIMDEINAVASPADIIVSTDADTFFGENYFDSVVRLFKKHPGSLALSNPYYHKLTGDETLDRALLRYEIYMRCYALNLWHIGSPYAFTALGSAIALPVSAYRKIGGMTPKKSGEDFYFLQKLRKAGKIMTWNSEKVYPATRYSDRVFFGTGPALIKGQKGDWKSYPIYHRHLFDDIKQSYNLFEQLFQRDVETPLDDFIHIQLHENNIWTSLRNNTRTVDSFVAACHQKIDGLRILQFLKWKNDSLKISDEEALKDFFDYFYPEDQSFNFKDFSFQNTSVRELDEMRDFLADREGEWQYKDIMQK